MDSLIEAEEQLSFATSAEDVTSTQQAVQNIWVDVILNDRVRRMYRLSTLRGWQTIRQMLFDWTMIRKIAWEHFVEPFTDKRDGPGKAGLGIKRRAQLPSEIESVMTWYSYGFFGNDSLLHQARTVKGYPWITDGKFECYGGNLEVPAVAPPKQPPKQTLSSPVSSCMSTGALAASTAEESRTQVCWLELPRAIREAFLPPEVSKHASRAQELKRQLFPTDLCWSAHLTDDKKFEDSKNETCFTWDTVPKEYGMGLLYNASWWALVIKLKARFYPRTHTLQVLLHEYQNPTLQTQWTSQMRREIELQVTKTKPFDNIDVVITHDTQQ